MSTLTKAIYLAWSRSRLSKKEISFHAELSKAKKVLIRLAENPPHTLFSLHVAAALRKNKRARKLTVLWPRDTYLNTPESSELFEEQIDITETPSHGSKAFKILKERLSNPSFDLFLDLDPSPLPELAILSAAKLRITYEDKGLFPFFNILFAPARRMNLYERARFMGRYLECEREMEEGLPLPRTTQQRANEWLKEHGHPSVRTPYILSSVPLGSEYIKGITVLSTEALIQEDPETKASVFASALAYIGKPDQGFELAYLLKMPCLVILDEKTPDLNLPSSPQIKVIHLQKGTLPLVTITEAIASLSP
jgi:hypothetical protein